MRKLCIFAFFILFACCGSSIFAGGDMEAADIGVQKEKSEITGGTNDADNTSRQEENRDRDWNDRISRDSSAVPQGTNRRDGVEDRIVAKKESAVPVQKEEKSEGPVLKLNLPSAPEKPASGIEPAGEKETAAATPQVVQAGGVAANFQTTGFSIGGNASVTYSVPASEEVTYTYVTISVRPKLGFIVAPKLALTLTPSLNWGKTDVDEITYSKTIDYGISAGVMYYFFSGGIIVPAVGTGLGFVFYPETDYQSSSFNLLLEPDFYTYFFVTDNLAPFIGVHAEISSPLDDPQITLGFSGDIGVAVFLPKIVRSSY